LSAPLVRMGRKEVRQVSEKLCNRDPRCGTRACRTWCPEVVVRVVDDGGQGLRAVRRFLVERYLEARSRAVPEGGGGTCSR